MTQGHMLNQNVMDLSKFSTVIESELIQIRYGMIDGRKKLFIYLLKQHLNKERGNLFGATLFYYLGRI